MKTEKKVSSLRTTKSDYTEKEMKEIHTMVDTVLRAPMGILPEELQGMVIVTLKNKKGEYLTLGGRRNMHDAGCMQLFLRILNMSPMDGAILLAQINADMKESEAIGELLGGLKGSMKKALNKAIKKTKN